jgi:hypothetical protein
VAALCFAIPWVVLVGLLAVARRGRPSAADHYRAIVFEDLTKLRRPIPPGVGMWVNDLEALWFRRLGEVSVGRRAGSMQLMAAPDRTTVAWLTNRPHHFGFDTYFADGAAVETTNGPNASVSDPDLHVRRVRGSVATVLEKHQDIVVAFAPGHGAFAGHA